MVWCFAQTFVGNKYGPLVLPMELSSTDFHGIKAAASELGKGRSTELLCSLSVRTDTPTVSFLDVKLFEQWYVLDESIAPAFYKLRDPDESYSNLLSRSISTYDLNTRDNEEWNDVYVTLVDLFLSVMHEKSNVKSTEEIQLSSAVEMLFHFSMKLSSSGCMCILRQFDGRFSFSDFRWVLWRSHGDTHFLGDHRRSQCPYSLSILRGLN